MSFISSHRRLLLGLGGVVAAAAVLLMLTSTSKDSGSTPSARTTVDSEYDTTVKKLAGTARRDPADPFALGRPDAPVVIVEFSDFQCSFCGKWARDVKPELMAKYIESGVLRIEFRSFPIFGAESETAAHASYAAAQQGQFWQFHDIAYAVERKKNTGAFTRDKVIDMARQAGITDMERFQADLDSPAARQHIAATAKVGYDIGVSSTPAFLVNGVPVLGARPTEDFIALIEQVRGQVPSP